MRLVSLDYIEFLQDDGCGVFYSKRGYDCIDIDTGVHYLLDTNNLPVPRYDAQGRVMVATSEELKRAINAFRQYKVKNPDQPRHTYTKL